MCNITIDTNNYFSHTALPENNEKSEHMYFHLDQYVSMVLVRLILVIIVPE